MRDEDDEGEMHLVNGVLLNTVRLVDTFLMLFFILSVGFWEVFLEHAFIRKRPNDLESEAGGL